MGAPAGQRLHARQRGRDVARLDRGCCSGCAPDAGRRSVLAASARVSRMARGVTRLEPQRLVESRHVALPRLPRLDPAGIHDLDGVSAGRSEHPGRVVAGPVALAGVHLAEQVLVVPQQDEEAAVHDRGVVELRVGVARGDRRDRRVEDGGVAQPGVAVAGGEGAGQGATGARARWAVPASSAGAATGFAACSSASRRRA